MKKILSVFGTRPEAIKMAPVINALAADPARFVSRVCVSAQHRQMLDQVLTLFRIAPDHDLDIMTPGQDLFDVTCAVMKGLKPVLAREAPDLVLVHGDTTTTMAAGLAAFYCGIPVGHVEAGLRTHDKRAPFPEEMNRRVAGVVADLHFAPTETARGNLLSEGVPADSVFVTGNTVIDALLATLAKIRSENLEPRIIDTLTGDFPGLGAVLGHGHRPAADRRLILVTGHRRENFGPGFERICRALNIIAAGRPEVDILYPVHLNPQVQEPVRRLLSGCPNIHLIDPLDYLPFVYLMHRAFIVLTDSGGVQEEAPALGRPVLVMRETTERPEAVAAGTVKLVGTDVDAIVGAVSALMDDPGAYETMARALNPYGDGKASARIAAIIGDRQIGEGRGARGDR